MENENSTNFPELIFGLVGPIGVDLEKVTTCLSEQLRLVNYKVEVIKITDLLQAAKGKKVDDLPYVDRYNYLIESANKFCAGQKSNAALAGLAISSIRERREAKTGDRKEPSLKTAYILRQLKRSEEISLLRRTYGRKFIQVSLFLSEPKRIDNISYKIRSDHNTHGSKNIDYERLAKDLIRRDFNEREVNSGQRISDIFHLGDVFVYGYEKNKIEKHISRFTQAFFGNNSITPNMDEYGMYLATAASFRSGDLSRQVGAAIFTKNAEIISLGSNEVPKSGGGTYWPDSDKETFRDVDRGTDANYLRKKEILADLVSRLSAIKVISEQSINSEDEVSIVQKILNSKEVKDSQLMDIIEFGRMMHAEMSAIVDAARLGRPVKGATLFCTTFPCHMCAKHIVGSGISRVVFLEPYPKSYASELHDDSITIEVQTGGKVLFEPFLGISPRRYRDIFEKGKRKNSKGEAKNWYQGEPMPLIEDKGPSYIQNEDSAIASSIGELASQSGAGLM